jgi:hypothetical protein
MKIVVTAPDVSHFQVDGSGDLEIQGYNQPGISLAINGSGRDRRRGQDQEPGAGHRRLGRRELDDLQTLNAEIAIAGSGNADVNAANQVKIAISGSGDVSLQTQPSAKPATSAALARCGITTETKGRGDGTARNAYL